MNINYIFSTNEYKYSFTDEDCKVIEFDIFSIPNLLIVINLFYGIFVLFIGYLYGRHQGIQSLNSEYNHNRILIDIPTTKKILSFLSSCWFVISIFVYPWYLCGICLFYAFKFNNINYITDYNPWILPITVIYLLYSFVVITTYSYYTHRNLKSKKYVKINILLTIILTISIIIILIKNTSTHPLSYAFTGFYTNNLKYCFNLSAENVNIIIVSIFIILFTMFNHQIYILFRSISARICDIEYLSQPKRVEYEYNDDDIDDFDRDQSSVTEYHNNELNDLQYQHNFEDIVIRNRSGSRFRNLYINDNAASDPDRSNASNSVPPSNISGISRASVVEYDNEPMNVAMPSAPVKSVPPQAYKYI